MCNETNLKEATGTETSNFALKSNLASLKSVVNKIDVNKFTTVPVNLSKLTNVVNNDAVKKTAYDKLVTKVNNIDTSTFVLKTKYDTDKSDLKIKSVMQTKKTPDTSGLIKKTDYNAKISEIESKMLSISGLVTNAALTAVENKIPNVSSLVKKQIIMQKLVKLKRKLLILIMMNILLLQSLII